VECRSGSETDRLRRPAGSNNAYRATAFERARWRAY
jgi:hypothetical protein